MKRNLIVAAALCAMAFTACNKPQKGLQEALNSEWNITEADGNAIKTTTGQAPYIGFDLKEGRIYGYSGCNRIMGSIDPKTQKPDFQRMGSTMMACPDMETESKVLAALNKAKDFKQEKDGSLALLDEKGNKVARLEKRFEDMAYAEMEGEWTIAKVFGQSLKTTKDSKSPALSFDTKANKLSGTTGCNRIMGGIEQGKDGPRSISFGQAATTRMACPDMENENNIMTALAQVKSFGKLKNGHLAFFNNSGMLILELAR